MTVEDAAKAMTALEHQHDGTKANAARINRLNEVLITNPEEFWDSFLYEFGVRHNPYREQAERLMSSGKVKEHTTFGDLPAILQADVSNGVSA